MMATTGDRVFAAYVDQVLALGHPDPEAELQADGSCILPLQDGSAIRWTRRGDGSWRRAERRRSGFVGELEKQRYVPGGGLHGVSRQRHREIRLACLSVHDSAAACSSQGARYGRTNLSAVGERAVCTFASGLRPDWPALVRIEQSQALVQRAFSVAFPRQQAKLICIDSNEFETSSSDVDFVVIADRILPHGKHARSSTGGSSSGDEQVRQPELACAMRDAMTQALGELSFEVTSVAAGDRVPLIRSRSPAGVSINIHFSRLQACKTRLLNAYANWDARVASLGRLVMRWADCRGVCDADRGHISSYGHALLVIHYLQHIGVVANLQDASLVNERSFGLTLHIPFYP